MITNDRQYRITKAEVEKFQEALREYSSTKSFKDIHPDILQAEKEALQFKLQELTDAMSEYQDLKEGRLIITQITDLKDLPLALIKSRISNGLTQLQLAERLGLKEQQIQRYESEKYDSASLKTLFKIAENLNLVFSGEAQLKAIESSEEYSPTHYPFKQMFQRKWFKDFKGSYNEALKKSAALLQELFDNAGVAKTQTALNRRSIRTNSPLNEFALNAWYARVITKAREQELTTVFHKELIDKNWLAKLTALSLDDLGPAKAIEHIKSSGIRVVIEPHLEQTHLDGAALLLDDFFPVIALTLRHDRLDNFWFVLLHELAHLTLHLGSELSTIFDDLDASIDGIELEADQFALNALIPNEVWRKSLARFSPTEKTITNQAKALKIHPALVAGRVRRETGRYFEFTELVGQGEVRINFADELTV